MSDVAIRVEGLSKSYRITAAQSQAGYKTLQEDLLALPRRAWSAVRGNGRRGETFWALKDVSFEVKEGEVLGIIGRNGAGKSTLLKILSRITEPTSGRAVVYGRVGSLLEVGTGFHQELTGRENIYLSGAILGMTRREVQRKFDEIVDFAGIEKFLDTPAKHYSSGMYMRLAFAVAAHLDPEILLVDEVLAVGDAEFQKKCLGKMGEVARGGRTVVFVSHQLNAIQDLCHSCVLIERGSIVVDGSVEKAINNYLGSESLDGQWTSQGGQIAQNPFFCPTRLAIIDQDFNVVHDDIGAADTFGITIEGLTETVHSALTVGFALYAAGGELLFWSVHTDTRADAWPPIRHGMNKLVVWMPGHLLNEGRYRVELILSLHFIAWLSQPGINAPAVSFNIRGGLSESPNWMMARPGLIAPLLSFARVE